LTTSASALAVLAQRVEMPRRSPEQGALLLLRRAVMIGSDAPLSDASAEERAEATTISATMDGLPLALDQAAAFIEETQCGLTDYLIMYRTQRAALLKERGGITSPHTAPLATTSTPPFDTVPQANRAAAAPVRLLA